MTALAQFNLARLKVPWDDPGFEDFTQALDPVNSSAELSPGFVWRLNSAADDSPELVAFEADGWLVNLTLWKSLQALQDFVRSTHHLAIMRRRSEWFSPVPCNLVLWWMPDGERPSFKEAMRRRDLLLEQGPTAEAFSFRKSFPPIGFR